MKNLKGKMILFLKRNWMKVGIIAILLFIVFKKDFSFRINFNTPLQPNEEQHLPVKQSKKKKKQELFTDNNKEQSISNKSSVLDQLSIPFWGSSKKKTKPLYLSHLMKIDDEIKNTFIKRFAHVAITEQKKYGIPASITMANALLNSWAGQAPWAKEGNNIFKFTCSEDWLGESNDYDGQCLRHYENAWTSFRDHSFFLSTGPHANEFSQLEATDNKAWAKLLSKTIFKGKDRYEESLLYVIDEYMLGELNE